MLHLRTTSTGRCSRPKLFCDPAGFSLAGSAFRGILLAVTGSVFWMQTVIALDGPIPHVGPNFRCEFWCLVTDQKCLPGCPYRIRRNCDSKIKCALAHPHRAGGDHEYRQPGAGAVAISDDASCARSNSEWR